MGLAQTIAIGALSVTHLSSQALAFEIVAAFVTATVGGLCSVLVSRIPGEVAGPHQRYLCCTVCRHSHLQRADVEEIFAALSLAVVLMGALQPVGPAGPTLAK